MSTVVSALRLSSIHVQYRKMVLLSFLLHGLSACSLFMLLLTFLTDWERLVCSKVVPRAWYCVVLESISNSAGANL